MFPRGVITLDTSISPLFQVVQCKELTANAGNMRDAASVLGWGRSPGVENGNPLQYSCLEHSTTEEPSGAAVCGVTDSWTQLSTHTEQRHFLQTQFY